ncbi:hypothetical protein ACH492_22190 [Streptomyces sp. NPDC019443]|uniref:hypothetical protein n=1 Tax=Streptomyces sp. NPDC019443 TaxID=3365061 RepID=UPI00379887B7
MTNPDPHNARAAQGRFIRTRDTAERDAEAARLRERGLSFPAIATELGFTDRGTARRAVQRVLKETVQEAGDELRKMELARLDAELVRLNALEESVRAVLERKHITVNNGKVIYVGDEPLEDDVPVLQAVDRLLKIEESRRRNGESRRKLLGLDEPVKTQVSGGVKYEIVGVDMGKLT